MAEDKKAFVAYTDWGDTFDSLTDEQAGKLVKHLFNYVRDNDPIAEDPMVKIAFIPMQQTLKRDLVKYEERAKRSRINGKKGGAPNKPRKPSGLNENPDEPKKPDRVSVSGRVSVKERVIDKDIYSINNIKSHLLETMFWFNKQISALQANGITVSKEQLIGYIDRFLIECDAKNDLDRELEDVKRHFTNWVMHKAKNDTKGNSNEQTKIHAT